MRKKNQGERMLEAIIEMYKALTENKWEGNQARFFLACEYGGFEDLAYQLWTDSRGGI